MSEVSTNEVEVTYWNGASGDRWAAAHERVDAIIGQIAAAAHDGVREGMRVIDIGCGCGGSTFEIARRVGETGWVLGVDVSEPMLSRARQRAKERGGTDVRFLQADAQTAELPAADLIHSRFGVMFFADPTAAFANLRAAVVPDGSVSAVVWQAPERNPWLTEPIAAVGGILDVPDRSQPGVESGPFALADTSHVHSILRAAGFREIEIEGRSQKLRMGASVEEAVDFSLNGVGPVAMVATEAHADARSAASDALAAHYSRLANGEGVFAQAAVWVVRAQA